MKIASALLIAALASGSACTDSHELGVTSHGFGETQWAVALAVGVEAQGDATNGIAFDSHGDAIATGGYRGTVDFGSGPVGAITEAGVFVSKRDPATGSEIWTDRITTGANDFSVEAASVAVGPDDNVFVAGTYEGDVGTTATSIDVLGTALPGTQAESMYIAKLSPTGALLWVKHISAANALQTGSYFAGVYLAVGSDGGVALATSYDGPIVALDGTTLMPPTGLPSTFVEKVDGDGSSVWLTDLPRVFGPSGFGIATNGDVVVEGVTDVTISIGSASLAPPASSNEWAARFSAAHGKPVWAEIVGDPNVPVSQGPLAIGADGDLVTAFSIFGTDSMTPFPALAELDSTGGAMWSTSAVPASPGGGRPLAVGIRPDGTALALGSTLNGAIDLGAGPVAGSVYLAAYDPTGASGEKPAVLGYCGASIICNMTGLAVASTGDVALSGTANGSADFGTGPLAIPAGTPEFVIAKISPQP
jgi:hypothetical protein